MQGGRILSAALGAALCLFAGAAFAQSACASLEARLAALQRSDGGAHARYEQASTALRREQDNYDATYRDARRLGCVGGGIFSRPMESASCGRVMAALERSDATLRRLQAERDRFAYNPRDIAVERRQVLEALAENRCGAQYEQFASRPVRRSQGLFGDLFGPRDDWFDYEGEADIPVVDTYRTVCVRTCDGSFFPISFATVRSQFGKDDQTCRSMCPGAEASLYVYQNPGADLENAVSLSGERYSNLPAAFAFRDHYNPGCTCGAAGAAVANFSPIDPANLGRSAIIPVPFPRPGRSEDPETLASRAGGTGAAARSDPAATATVAGLDRDRTVRLIGPAYYYAQ